MFRLVPNNYNTLLEYFRSQNYLPEGWERKIKTGRWFIMSPGKVKNVIQHNRQQSGEQFVKGNKTLGDEVK